MTHKHDSRNFFFKQNGVIEQKTFPYTIYFNGEGTVVDIRNEFGFSVEKQSECWQYFTKKYSSHV